ncbi:hypothetical protein B0H17DRAFT_945412 [Mycena rosella]|uniref:Uncharacterized protein n=1 Tax=Mycena rosella TaxID=1033263 RepID=A0AAD7G897_MYCRO|nr:hypothetical protein B0H17DRAFT_945412 [Mycena rosella]
MDQEQTDEASALSDDESDGEQPPDRDNALENQDTEEEDEDDKSGLHPVRKHRHKGKIKPLSALELRDKHYFLEYITTTKCRHIPWNKFFGNKYKSEYFLCVRKHRLTGIHTERLNYPVPDGPCCDNCHPKKFPVETIVLVSGHQLKAGRKEKSPPELEVAVREKLNDVREQIVVADFPNENFLTGNVFISDDVVDTLAKRARLLTFVDTILQHTYWIFAQKYGDKVIAAIQDFLTDFPDLAKEVQETQVAKHAQRMLDAAAFKELRSKLVIVFDGCYDIVYLEMEATPAKIVTTARKHKKEMGPRRRCQLFLSLP